MTNIGCFALKMTGMIPIQYISKINERLGISLQNNSIRTKSVSKY